jgi:hypothetical protein
VPNLLIEYVMRNAHVPFGLWRGAILAATGRPVRSLPLKQLKLV